MKIKVIFTGGTIGSKLNEDGYIGTTNKAPYCLISKFEKVYGNKLDDIKFSFSEPYTILSENLSADNLNSLIEEISKTIESEEVDGIIITHGTDTLQYTASVLGYVFARCGVPIILVSSAYILSDERENGTANFYGAVKYIFLSKNDLFGVYNQGVFVSYKNSDGKHYIHRGTRLNVSMPYSGDVYSVDNTYVAYFDEENIRINGDYLSFHETESVEEMLLPMDIRLNKYSGILMLRYYPGFVWRKAFDIRNTEGISSIIIETYHSGTIGVNDDFRDFVDECQMNGIKVYLHGYDMHSAGYETVKEYDSLGVKILPKSALISQYCKMWISKSVDIDFDLMINKSIGDDLI